MSDKADLDFVRSETNQKKIAERILRSIETFAAEKGVAKIGHQADNTADTARRGEPIFEQVEIEPQFPGGTKAWESFRDQHLDPSVASRSGAPAGHYTAWVIFVVDKNGQIRDTRPLSSLGYGMEKELMRVVGQTAGWLPGIQNGHKVSAYVKVRADFVVSS